MDGLRRFLAIVHADFRERSRSTRFWAVLIGVGIATWWIFPPMDAGYVTVAIGRARGLYSSAWIGMVLGVIYGTLVALFGFYIVRGTLTRDFETRVWQLLVATPMTRPAYLVAKWTSHMLVFGLIVLVGLAVGLAAQVYHGESTAYSPWQLLLPSLVFALPSLALAAFFAVLFDLVPWLRRSGGNVLYFFIWIFTFIATAEYFDSEDVAWVQRTWLTEPSGVSAAMRDMRDYLAVAMPGLNTADFSIGVNITASKITTFTWDAWSPQPMVLLGRALWVLACLAGLLALAPALDWAAARSEARQPGQRSSAGFRLVWMDWLLRPLEGFPSGRLFAAEAKLVLRQRRLSWWLAIAVLMVVQATAPPEGQAIAVIVAWMSCLDVFARAGLRETDTGTSALVFTAEGAARRILGARLALAVALALGLAGPALVRAIASDPLVALGVIAIASSIAVGGLALAAACRNPRPFELALVFMAYIGVQREPILNAHADPVAALALHAWLLPTLVLVLAIAWPLSVRRR